MDIWKLGRVDIGYLDSLLMENRLPKSVPASVLQGLPLDHLQQWCVRRGVYQIVTDELLEWLAQRIRGRVAIEICAGHGTIGRALGIMRTDSYMQTRPEIKAYYAKIRQATIQPPPDVVCKDANAIVQMLKPEVVIGAWVTQKWMPGDDQGSVEGVDELALVATGTTYIHIGNDKSHGYKRLMREAHDHHYFPWLFSRGQHPEQNHLCVWPREEPRCK